MWRKCKSYELLHRSKFHYRVSYRGLKKKFPEFSLSAYQNFPEFTVINLYETPSKQNLNPKFVLNQTLLLLSVLKLNATKMQSY